MRYLVSLPENLINSFHQLSSKSKKDWFCTSDPIGAKVGSGGGTSWLLSEAWKSQNPDKGFNNWLSEEKRILLTLMEFHHYMISMELLALHWVNILKLLIRI